jgi:hypothetical protein
MHGHHRLRDPVGDRRHAQHSNPAAVRLGDLHRPDRGREVGPRAHPIPDLVEVARKIVLELLDRLPVHSRRALVGLDPAATPPRPSAWGSQTACLRAVACCFASSQGLAAPVERIVIPDQPAPSLHPHPREQELRRYYGPVRQRAPRLVLSAFGALPRHAPSRGLGGLRPRPPYRRSPSHVPCQSRRPGSRRLHAGHRLASNRDARQADHKGTARPLAFDAT